MYFGQRAGLDNGMKTSYHISESGTRVSRLKFRIDRHSLPVNTVSFKAIHENEVFIGNGNH